MIIERMPSRSKELNILKNKPDQIIPNSKEEGLGQFGFLAVTNLLRIQLGDRFFELIPFDSGLEGFYKFLREEGRHMAFFDGQSEILKNDEAYQAMSKTFEDHRK